MYIKGENTEYTRVQMPSLNTKPIDSTFAIIVFFLESLVFPHCSTSWPWGRSTFTRINFSYTNIHGKKNHWNQNTRNPSPFTNRRWVLTSWTGRKQTHTLKEIQKIITWEHSLWDDRRPRAHPPPTSNNSWGQTDRQGTNGLRLKDTTHYSGPLTQSSAQHWKTL